MNTGHPSKLSRFGVVGDPHAEDRALRHCIELLEAQQVDRILCVGDIADGPGDVDRCCQLLREQRVVTVRGNHDRWLLAGQMRDLNDATDLHLISVQSRAFLEALPATVELSTVHGPLLLCHGLGTNDMAQLRPDDEGYAIEANLELQELIRSQRYRYVICGHTHHRMVRRFGPDRLTVINAGTLLRGHEPCFLLVELERGRVRALELGPDGHSFAEEVIPL
jgi:predicted phosphodiesterase